MLWSFIFGLIALLFAGWSGVLFESDTLMSMMIFIVTIFFLIISIVFACQSGVGTIGTAGCLKFNDVYKKVGATRINNDEFLVMVKNRKGKILACQLSSNPPSHFKVNIVDDEWRYEDYPPPLSIPPV